MEEGVGEGWRRGVGEAARVTAGYGVVWRKLLQSEKGSSSR